jgi:hypothetical protein
MWINDLWMLAAILKQYAWYPGGEEVAKKIVEDIKTFLSEE